MGFQKARRLSEVSAAVEIMPLESDDVRYQDMSAGRVSDDLLQMRELLGDYEASSGRYAKIAITGHRGCGKSTELLRLEHEVGERFTCLHVMVENALIIDCDYTDLFLWLTDELIRRFAELSMPLDRDVAEDVARWFAEVTEEETRTVLSQAAVEASAEVSGKLGLFATALRLLGRLKSSMRGSIERRRLIRQKLQRYSSELILRVNRLLDDAHRALAEHGRPANLLIVFDNLDRVTPQVGETLFFHNGELLKPLRAHAIFTVPIAIVLSPLNIETVFSDAFTLPMVKIHEPSGKPFKKGIDALTRLLARRVEIDEVFRSRAVVRHLVTLSGGSVRDLMRLVQGAQLAARGDGKEKIDMASARKAVLRTRLHYERLLIPGGLYFRLLAQVHLTHLADMAFGVRETDAEEVRSFRDFFSQLLFNGAVLEYDGGKAWYDVHPIVQGIQGFQEALADARKGEAPAS